MRWARGPNDRGLSRWHLIRDCEASLKRLRTDVIDLYQMHQWDGLTPLEETMEALDSLVRAGKVRYIGCSNYSGWHMMKAMEVARRDGRVPFVSEQIHYSLQAREAEYELIPVAINQKLGVLAWARSPAACSAASIAATSPEGTRHMAGWAEPPIRDEDSLWSIVDELVAIGEAHGVSAAQIALAWLLGRPAVTSLIIGGRTEAQFRDNLASVDVKLTDDERARLDKVEPAAADLSRTGISRERRATASAPPTSRCTRLICRTDSAHWLPNLGACTDCQCEVGA